MIEKPQTWRDLLESMTPEIHQSLKTAIELGKWPNGERLSPQQVELCLQAVIAYDQRYLIETERVAYIDTTKVKTKHCGDA